MGGKIFGGLEMKELKECPICGSKNFDFLYMGRDKLLGISGNFSLFKCKNCELIFLNPQPNYQELEKYYSNEKYYSLKKIDTTSKKLKIKLLLYKTYFNEENKTQIMRLLLSPLKFIIRGTLLKKNTKLLDIGGGSGQFLYEMRELGMNVCGIEPGDFDKESNTKYKLNIKNVDLIKAKYPEDSFDLITMNHVLEHVNNPNETVMEIKKVLRKDGTLIIGIPNTNSLARKIFGKNWLAYDVPRHLFNYSGKNLNPLLEKNGFRISKIRYNSRPNQFVVSLYFLLGVKKKTGILNRILEGIFLPLTWIVNSLKSGDQIEVWCVKK